jgi:hypothetical protein
MPCGATPPFFPPARLGRPAGPSLGRQPARPETPATADRRQFSLAPGRSLRTRGAGLFLFLPLLARVRVDELVAQAGYPGSQLVRPTSALLSLLALKLLDKERRSHISDFDFDEALGLFAGLNILPKKSFATDYSYRTQRRHQERLLSGWVARLSPLLFPKPQAFCLDFHTIPYRGDPTGLDTHYLAKRGKAGPSVLTFFAQEYESRVLCSANANLSRADQAGELMRFVEFWHALSGQDPQWLSFDSKLVPSAELSRVNQHGIFFVTIRRRGEAILRRLRTLPAIAWQPAELDIPKRRHKHVRYIDESLSLTGYQGSLRQLAVDGLGREHPTLLLSNNFEVSARELLLRYAARNRVEDALGSSIDFFHLDCLASEVRLNVDLDTALTVLAHGCYRWLATQLHGFDKAKPKQVYRKFVETGGQVTVQPERILVRFDKRAHIPLIREATLDKDGCAVPWLNNLPVVFEYP